MELREILSRCDHTLLRVDATAAEIRALCDQGMRYGCASVCIPPCHVAGAKKYVGDRLRICTVIGFPNGYNTPAVKAFEAAPTRWTWSSIWPWSRTAAGTMSRPISAPCVRSAAAASSRSSLSAAC